MLALLLSRLLADFSLSAGVLGGASSVTAASASAVELVLCEQPIVDLGVRLAGLEMRGSRHVDRGVGDAHTPMKVVVLTVARAGGGAPRAGARRRAAVAGTRTNKVSMDVTILRPRPSRGGEAAHRRRRRWRHARRRRVRRRRVPRYGGGGMMMAPPMFCPSASSRRSRPLGSLRLRLPTPLLLFALAGLALTSFRDQRVSPGSRGGGSAASPTRRAPRSACSSVLRDSRQATRSTAAAVDRADADTNSYSGLQRLVSTCLAMRSNRDWSPRAPRARPPASSRTTSRAVTTGWWCRSAPSGRSSRTR